MEKFTNDRIVYCMICSLYNYLFFRVCVCGEYIML